MKEPIINDPAPGVGLKPRLKRWATRVGVGRTHPREPGRGLFAQPFFGAT